ncbi:MAG: tRNA (adenosine(37)-N6)-threonylcarbamoyltransferase complex transferase subunit TsaD [Bacteroidetes bacterium]|nr:tRNA (adenosine(37)-N6)-threonylcarbamoyltransferase complex transferase subunit TsaD [Bacteroidota bacterium]
MIILGIESSCDDTAAAVIQDGKLLANIVAGQGIHQQYGGIVPELASRAHQQNIVPLVDSALKKADITKEQLSAVAFTRGPGLIGSLLVGTSFAKGFAMALNIPLIEVHHMQAHVLAHFITDNSDKPHPEFPFLCLTVSGGHTQIVLVKDHLGMKIIGETIDDAAGEAFDKSAKIMGLPYPGGPFIDQLAEKGNPDKFKFPHPQIPELNFSFSGLKTSFLYFINEQVKRENDFIEKNKADLCASIQKTIIDILLAKLKLAAKQHNISRIAVAGGVSANKGLRKALEEEARKSNWSLFIPPFEYCTDNAAMIAITGYYKFLIKDFCDQNTTATARYPM